MKNFDITQIESYLRNKMSPEERAQFEAELAADPELRRRTAELRQFAGDVRYIAQEDIRKRVEAVRDKIKREETAQERPPGNPPPGWTKPLAMLVFGMLLGLGFGHQVFGGAKSDPEQPGQEQTSAAVKLDSFVFYAPSGEKFIVYTSTGDPLGTQTKLQIIYPQGHLMGDFYQNDTLYFLKINPQSKPASPPGASIRQDSSGNVDNSQKLAPAVAATKISSSEKVAEQNNNKQFLNSMLLAYRIRVAGEQKTVEPLPAIQVNAYDEPGMRCVFYGDRIQLSVPAEMVEGQPVEVLELQGAGTEDGFYLRIGKQFFRLEKSGYSFDLIAIPKPKAFD